MNIDKLKTVTDNKTYKYIRYSRVLGCPICGPNAGCNRRDKKVDRSWKRNRKTKYKPQVLELVSPSPDMNEKLQMEV